MRAARADDRDALDLAALAPQQQVHVRREAGEVLLGLQRTLLDAWELVPAMHHHHLHGEEP